MNKIFLSNNRITKKNIFHLNFVKLVLTLFLIVFIVALVISPDKYIKITFNGILVWATAILPALFPFMIFTKLLTSTGYIEQFSRGFSYITKKLYKVPSISSYIFLMSIISGYPLGAKITADLYEEGSISRSEAHRICAFTSNSGPMFIVGTVGVGMLISPIAGYILLISHILSALINGFLYRGYNPKEQNGARVFSIKVVKNNSDILTNSMENSIKSVMLIGGFITIFFVISEIFASLQIFYPFIQFFSLLGINESITNGLIFGFFEVTKGCLTIASSGISEGIRIILCSFIISFGGLSVIFQSLAFLNKFKISKKFFFLQKLTHALISLMITLTIVLLLKI